MISSGNYERAGAKTGPTDGIYATSFTAEGGTFPSFVQISLEGNTQIETIEHSLSKDAMSSSKKKKYQQVESPLPQLYYYE